MWGSAAAGFAAAEVVCIADGIAGLPWATQTVNALPPRQGLGHEPELDQR
jgi:hypothetical protein